MEANDQEFSTFDAVRILGIDRGRLVQWMRGEFIPLGKDVPWGKGYKTAFSLFDLYSIELFRECVDFSLSREVAKRCWLYVDWARIIKEKLWLMAVAKQFEIFIRDRAKNINLAISGRYEMLETIGKPKNKLPVRKKPEKVPSLPKPFKLQTGETIFFKRNFQSLRKSDSKKGGGIMIVIDLKNVVDFVNMNA